MSYGDFDDAKNAIGRKVASAEVSEAGLDARLAFAGGGELGLSLSGDCCSSSYFSPEGKAALRELVGATILAVEDRDGPSADDDKHPSTDDYSEVSWHFLVFVTDRGYVTVDWRNDSNGYYDGWVDARWAAPGEGDATP